MPKPYQQPSADAYPLLSAADDLVALLQKLDLHGWEAYVTESDPAAWRLRPQFSMGRPDQWAVIRRQASGFWGVSEQCIALSRKGVAPWERLRELADQLEREAAS